MNSDDFWNFSIKHYSKPGVADSCLALQDEHGVDINLLLFCIWYGQNSGELSQSQLDEVISFSMLWAENVVKPLRQTRRWIKRHKKDTGIPADKLEKLREKIKQMELEAERRQQNQMQQLVQFVKEDCRAGSSIAAQTNLDYYLQSQRLEKTENVARHLGIITSQL